MSLRVRLIGDLRRFVEADAIDIEGGARTLGGTFEEMGRLYPRLSGQLFDDRGRLHYAVVLMIGGRRVSWPADRDEVIEDGGELLLTRFHSGG